MLTLWGLRGVSPNKHSAAGKREGVPDLVLTEMASSQLHMWKWRFVANLHQKLRLTLIEEKRQLVATAHLCVLPVACRHNCSCIASPRLAISH